MSERELKMPGEPLDNETLWKLYSPKPHPWFSADIVYEGWGIATFERPVGTIEGKTKVIVDETGRLEIVVEYEELHTSETIHGNHGLQFAKFLQGDLTDRNMVTIGTENINPCSGLVVQTDSGEFHSEGRVYYSQGLGFDSMLRLYISKGIYHDKSATNPIYWVLPLTNFVSTFHLNPHPLLAQHPLRLYSTPMVPAMKDEERMRMALFVANRANTLIGFEFGGKVGYIQPVLDYSERETKLKGKEVRQCITALMVSEITPNLNETQLAYDYPNLISFAAGAQVGAAWIEFRNESGDLVSRRHLPNQVANYEQGYSAIDSAIHAGLGQLISLASNSSEFGKPYFRVLVAHLVRLQSNNRQIEDHMDLLCRTFDMLTEEFGLSKQNLSKQLPLDFQTKVRSIIDTAKREVEKLSSPVGTAIGPVLHQIAGRIANAANTDRAFGLAVMELLKMYDLPDAEIMSRFYSQHSVSQNTSWAQILSKYRGATIHSGYFSDNEYDIHEVLELEDHLHDILVRIVLKTLGYQGDYQPRVIPYLVDGKTTAWLDADTPAAKLGYQTPIV